MSIVNATFVGEEYIRYGFLSKNSVEFIDEEIMNGINLSYLNWCEERKKELETELEEKEGEHLEISIAMSDYNKDFDVHIPKEAPLGFQASTDSSQLNDKRYKLKERIAEIENMLESEDYGEYEEDNDVYLLGDWKQDEEGYYVPDREGSKGYSAKTSELDICVVWSKYTRMCNKCSPCCPNAGDLDSTGNLKTFDLPPDLYGKEKLFEKYMEDEENHIESMDRDEFIKYIDGYEEHFNDDVNFETYDLDELKRLYLLIDKSYKSKYSKEELVELFKPSFGEEYVEKNT